MIRFFIKMKANFEYKELREKLDEKKIACMFVIGEYVVVTGEGRYGDFCSTLWHCQKYGRAICEVTPE